MLDKYKLERYHSVIIIIHWLSALLIIGAIGVGLGVLDDMPNSDPEKIDFLRIHLLAGIVLLVLTLLRIVFRLRKPVPSSEHFDNVWLNRAGRGTHLLLYLVLVGVLASGIGISVLSGLPEIIFQGIGQLPETFEDFPPHKPHSILARILAALVVLHVIAALYHQFAKKDGLFSRMWFR